LTLARAGLGVSLEAHFSIFSYPSLAFFRYESVRPAVPAVYKTPETAGGDCAKDCRRLRKAAFLLKKNPISGFFLHTRGSRV